MARFPLHSNFRLAVCGLIVALAIAIPPARSAPPATTQADCPMCDPGPIWKRRFPTTTPATTRPTADTTPKSQQ